MSLSQLSKILHQNRSTLLRLAQDYQVDQRLLIAFGISEVPPGIEESEAQTLCEAWKAAKGKAAQTSQWCRELVAAWHQRGDALFVATKKPELNENLQEFRLRLQVFLDPRSVEKSLVTHLGRSKNAWANSLLVEAKKLEPGAYQTVLLSMAQGWPGRGPERALEVLLPEERAALASMNKKLWVGNPKHEDEAVLRWVLAQFLLNRLIEEQGSGPATTLFKSWSPSKWSTLEDQLREPNKPLDLSSSLAEAKAAFESHPEHLENLHVNTMAAWEKIQDYTNTLPSSWQETLARSITERTDSFEKAFLFLQHQATTEQFVATLHAIQEHQQKEGATDRTPRAILVKMGWLDENAVLHEAWGEDVMKGVHEPLRSSPEGMAVRGWLNQTQAEPKPSALTP